MCSSFLSKKLGMLEKIYLKKLGMLDNYPKNQ